MRANLRPSVCATTESASGVHLQLWRRILNSESPTASELNTVLVVAFADLKKYAFFYWFAFPALLAKPAWQVASPWVSLSSSFTEPEVQTAFA